MENDSFATRKDNRWASPLALAFYFAAAKLLLHLLCNNHYGYFRDELYYIACGEHLDWGYVDHAPLVALAAKASRITLGDSLFDIRFLPALAGALKVLVTGLMARELGGRRFAVALGCLCVLIASGYLLIDNFLSMNAFEPVFWTSCAYMALLAIKRGEPRYWLLFGVFAGLGLQNKHSMLFFGVAIVVGLVLTKKRTFLLSRWLWIGGAIAFVIFLPNIIWERQHDWATLELLHNAQASGKNVVLSPLAFIGQQFLILSPPTAPVWLAGLFYFLFESEGKRFRVLGVAYLVVLLLMIALHGKNYYLLPAYPMLFAAGGVYCEKLLANKRRLVWLKVAYPALLLISGIVLAPLFLPILPIETLLRYQNAMGFKPPKSEVAHEGVLPQHFGDMFGWEATVEKVAQVYNRLAPEERGKAAIYASNYGEAGAVDFFGAKYNLPKAISPHQNYFLWGPRNYTGEVLILLQSKRADAEGNCESVEEGPEVFHPYAMAEEHYTIYICRGLKKPLPELWPKLKHWN